VIKTLVLVIKEKEKTDAHFVDHQIILTVSFGGFKKKEKTDGQLFIYIKFPMSI
jgi:hypothetical protein